MEPWYADFVSRTPILQHFHDVAGRLADGAWPTREQLRRLLEEAAVCTANGQILRPVMPQGGSFESRIFEQGELEFREGNWHDLFNVLTWLVFPQSKAALNARHYSALSEAAAVNRHRRGAVRDALTLIDESGLLVVSSNPALLQMIREFRWKPLFWEQRHAVISDMHFLPFGHALCEKALNPYIGMTAHGLLLDAEAGFFALSAAERMARLDRRLARLLDDAQAFQGTAELAPVPLLGIPGWHERNRHAGFYDDNSYFRTGRRSAAAAGPAGRGGTA